MQGLRTYAGYLELLMEGKMWEFEFDEEHNVLRIYRAEDGVGDSMGPELTSPAEVGEFIDDLQEAAVRHFGAAR